MAEEVAALNKTCDVDERDGLARVGRRCRRNERKSPSWLQRLPGQANSHEGPARPAP